jgi:hypothetical protein
MREIWRHNGHEIHTLAYRKLALFFDHLLKREVNPVFRKKKRMAGVLGNIRIDTECSTDQFDQSVHIRGNPVNCSYEGVFAPTYHTHSKFAIHKMFD